jgi:hypothetical protein
MKEDILPIDTPTEAQWQQVSSTKRRPQYPPADSPKTDEEIQNAPTLTGCTPATFVGTGATFFSISQQRILLRFVGVLTCL